MRETDALVRKNRKPATRAWLTDGIRAAAHAVRFARDQVGARAVFDPFCGVGAVLAVANALWLDALVRGQTAQTLRAREDAVDRRG